jgi:signal transduction histidine kinase
METTKKPIILIVDDVPKNIQVLGTLLAKFNCELAVAMNGQQALDTVAKIHPDLILLDVMMPIMDGHETCQRLKSNPKTKDIPVIFLSAKTESEDIVKGFELGAVDYVTKPFIGSELLARVKTHLSLKKAQQIVEEEVNTKNKFFSIMSHDLRGAFGIIMSFVELIQVNREYLTQDEIDELLNDIAKTSKNTLELLEDLLKWARSQTGAIQFNPEKLVIKDLFTKICEKQKDIAQAKDIQLSSSATEDKIIVGDSNMLLLIIRNLIANAIKFTNKGGKITVSAEDTGNFIRTEVTDTGVGIKPETISKLFCINSKVSTSGTDNEQGSGLGLVLCKEFVKINGGEIGVESIPGEGTTVWFTIPKYKEEE